MTVSVVGLDADDTLWHSENHFAVTEERFRALLQPWLPADAVGERLLSRERANLELFGYGAKGFTLSMIETALEISEGQIAASAIQELIGWGKELLSHPVELLDQVEETVKLLSGSYRLALITKGDLFHQESKVAESGLADYFDRVEILTEKSPASYRRVLGRLDVEPSSFVMVGNSLRSDVLPVVEIGGLAVHIPYGITWGHEAVEPETETITWSQITSLAELPPLLSRLANPTAGLDPSEATIPVDAEYVRTTPTFTETTVPPGLLNDHRVAAGAWAKLEVVSGALAIVFSPDGPIHLGAGDEQVIPPERPHHLVIDGPAVFHLHFYRGER